jgi:hypothetical protein
VEGDLRIGGLIVGRRRRDGLRLAEPIDLHHPGHDRAVGGLPDQRGGKPIDSASEPKAMKRQLRACTRAEPMRSSQTWAAR